MILSWPMLQPYPKFGLWRVIDPIVVYFKHREARIYIPASFWTDLASVPNWGWPSLSCGPQHLVHLGLVHDFASCHDARWHDLDGIPHEITFDDSLYFGTEVMVEDGIGALDRWKVISTLKFMSYSYWHEDSILWTPDQRQ